MSVVSIELVSVRGEHVVGVQVRLRHTKVGHIVGINNVWHLLAVGQALHQTDCARCCAAHCHRPIKDIGRGIGGQTAPNHAIGDGPLSILHRLSTVLLLSQLLL